MWAALSDSVTETGSLFLVELWLPLVEFFDNSRRLCVCVCVCPCHCFCVCVFVLCLCVPAIPQEGGNSSFQRWLLRWFCFKWCEEWLQAARFPVAWRCGRINYRDIGWQASKDEFDVKRDSGVDVEPPKMRHRTRLEKKSNSTGILFVLPFVKCSCCTLWWPARAFVEHSQHRRFLPITAHHQSHRIPYDSQPRSAHRWALMWSNVSATNKNATGQNPALICFSMTLIFFFLQAFSILIG